MFHNKFVFKHTAGSVPLRQLVYRVLALPPSMQPLVYDFGQLTNTTEKDYTIQIVTDRVSHLQKLRCYLLMLYKLSIASYS